MSQHRAASDISQHRAAVVISQRHAAVPNQIQDHHAVSLIAWLNETGQTAETPAKARWQKECTPWGTLGGATPAANFPPFLFSFLLLFYVFVVIVFNHLFSVFWFLPLFLFF